VGIERRYAEARRRTIGPVKQVGLAGLRTGFDGGFVLGSVRLGWRCCRYRKLSPVWGWSVIAGRVSLPE
jgi:hypothetical protein